MKYKSYIILIILLPLIILGGCSTAKSGNDISGFCLRMNEISEKYELSPDGYIIKSDYEKYRFFKFSDNEIMINFTADNNGSLTGMDIAADENAIKSADVEQFIIDSITSFINDNEISTNLLSEIPYSSFREKTLKSKTAKCENVTLIVDATDTHTLISVYIER